MNQKIRIQPIQTDDIKQLIDLSKQCFHQTFDSCRALNDVNTYIKSAYTQEKLQSELKTATSRMFFAFVDNQIAGYLKVNWGMSQTETKWPSAFEIQRIYVLKQFQGRHVGSELMIKAISLAKEKHFRRIWLGVWEHNDKAQKFYHYFGFKAKDEHIFMMGDTPQRDLMMVKDI
ncbi:GNAT family N-acetyltransferase [Lactobacillus psittaci]|nr:GNAT family N-acetyltransferase [Lactobacillus psittaci]